MRKRPARVIDSRRCAWDRTLQPLILFSDGSCMAKIWTEEHEQFIRENFRHKTYAELADHFGVTQKAMESKIRRMGLKKQDYREPEPMPSVLPPEPEEAPRPVETGPTPIRRASALTSRKEEPVEAPEERKERLAAELDAAGEEKTRREQHRDESEIASAIKQFETGLAKYHDGSLGKALEAFNRVVDSAPSDAVLIARSRQYIGAIERRGRSAGFEPQNADEYYLVGVLNLNQGDPATALSAFEKALDLAPGDDRVLYCQAAAHAQKGDIDNAITALREAIDINDANRIYALNDPDFVPLRVHEDFRSITSPED